MAIEWVFYHFNMISGLKNMKKLLSVILIIAMIVVSLAEMTAKSGKCTDTLTWSVDKPSIATVDENGVVTALTAGKVKVTATSGSGKKATCTVTVTE